MSYLDNPAHAWVIDPAASTDSITVLYELLTRLSPEAAQRYSWKPDFIAALHEHAQPPYRDLLDAVVNPPKGTRLLGAFNTLLAALRLPPVTDDDGHAEARDLVLRGALGLHASGAGSATQCLDTAMIWYYG